MDAVADVRKNAQQLLSDLRRTVERARIPILNGALARIGVTVALFPLDTIKTRAQLRTIARAPHKSELLLGGAHQIHPKISLLRGLPAGVLAAAGAGALSFAVFSTLVSRRTATVASTTSVSVVNRAAATPWVAAEVVAAAFALPLETAKTRVQARVADNAIHALRMGPLYAGVGAHLTRELASRFLALALAAKVGTWIANRRGGQRLPPMGELAATAAVVGTLTAPLDLIRTRVLTQRPGAARLYRNFVACGARVVRREGPLAAFRAAPLRVAYLVASTTLFVGAYSLVERSLQERKLLWYADHVE